ncbi:hypothetical protein KAU32_10400 [bacterium]|nr:hypothetical protein [bacterium]
MKCKRCVIPNMGSQIYAINNALDRAKKMSQESGKDIVFLVPNKYKVRYSNIGKALGSENAVGIWKKEASENN